MNTPVELSALARAGRQRLLPDRADCLAKQSSAKARWYIEWEIQRLRKGAGA